MHNSQECWPHWNVRLHISNDEHLYRRALYYIRMGGKPFAARSLMGELISQGITHTPDGAAYSQTAIRKAIRHLN